MLPLYEAKMIHLYDTRWATYEADGSTRLMTADEKAKRLNPMPRYWVGEQDVDWKVGDRGRHRGFIGWRRICRATDARTLILAQGPRVGYGDSWFLAVPDHGLSEIQALGSSHAADYVSRQKLGGTNMNFFTFMQLPMPRPEQVASAELPFDRPLPGWLGVRVDRLNGWIVDELERAHVRAELDAAAFHLYGLTRDEVSHVMDTFPIVKRKDEAAFGTYRTKELILAAYDAMAEARASGQVYRAPWAQEVTT